MKTKKEVKTELWEDAKLIIKSRQFTVEFTIVSFVFIVSFLLFYSFFNEQKILWLSPCFIWFFYSIFAVKFGSVLFKTTDEKIKREARTLLFKKTITCANELLAIPNKNEDLASGELRELLKIYKELEGEF